MKKLCVILSFLAMFMATVPAFATDTTDTDTEVSTDSETEEGEEEKTE